MPRSWSLPEIETLVNDYLAMFALELRGESFNKAAHNRSLQKLIGRSHRSIEMKHQNVSAVLRDIGSRYIDGYKPLGNYQDLLYDVVVERFTADRALAKLLVQQADAMPVEPTFDDILARLVGAPVGRRRGIGQVSEKRIPRPVRGAIDYLAREARNSALGSKGEAWVLAFERARLIREGKEQLADRVEQVSVTIGASEGFDIRSFERNGVDRLIEVKATAGPIGMGFFVSPNEVETSRAHEARYHLYRPFSFNRDPHLFIVRGRLDRTCLLEASEFRAQVA